MNGAIRGYSAPRAFIVHRSSFIVHRSSFIHHRSLKNHLPFQYLPFFVSHREDIHPAQKTRRFQDFLIGSHFPYQHCRSLQIIQTYPACEYDSPQAEVIGHSLRVARNRQDTEIKRNFWRLEYLYNKYKY
jgi:hypothetical protein